MLFTFDAYVCYWSKQAMPVGRWGRGDSTDRIPKTIFAIDLTVALGSFW